MWHAIYDENDVLHQYDEKKERLFKDINLERLRIFEVDIKNKTYGVCLDTGYFRVNGEFIKFDGYDKNEKFKLIYFRRVKQLIGGGESKQGSITQYVGWQIEGSDTKPNRKILMYINERGMVGFEIK